MWSCHFRLSNFRRCEDSQAAEEARKKRESMTMSFDIPKLRLISADDLYDKPILPNFDLPGLNRENPLTAPGGIVPQIPKNE